MPAAVAHAAAYKVYIDWSGDGTFVQANEDATARVLDSRQAVTTAYGRDQARNLSPIKAGTAGLALNNHDRFLSPENTSSPLYGVVLPGRRVKITCTPYGGAETVLFYGYLDDFDLQPDYEDHYVTADCLDSLGRLKGQKVSTRLYQGIRPGEAIGVILDEIGWPATDRDIETGATIMPFWWVDDDDAFEAVMDLINSEGPPSLVTVDSTDRFIFRSRHHRLQRTASLNVQSTWTSGTVEPAFSAPAVYNHGWQEIINSIVFQLPQRKIGPVERVWQSDGTITIAAGDTLPVTATSSEAFIDAITPIRTTNADESGQDNGDYTLVSGTVQISLSRTSGQSTTIYLIAIGGAVVIENLQLRANPISTVNQTKVKLEDQGSITKFGKRSLDDDDAPLWASRADAYAIGQIILGLRAERLPTLSVTMVGAVEQRLTQMLTRNLSDRVHITESHTGLDADCYIEQISHDVSQGGAEHATVFGLEKIQLQIPGAFILGTSLLGTGKLGRRGFTDPALMFVLGSVTNGLLGSRVLSA